MALTKEDRAFLFSLGNGEQDLSQIGEALRPSRTAYSLDGGQITQAEAIRLLGRERFLAGVSRSAFHFTAAQTIGDGKTVYFDSYKLFKGSDRNKRKV